MDSLEVWRRKDGEDPVDSFVNWLSRNINWIRNNGEEAIDILLEILTDLVDDEYDDDIDSYASNFKYHISMYTMTLSNFTQIYATSVANGDVVYLN